MRGHKVRVCGSLRALRDCLEEGDEPDLAFVDWSLPDATGAEVASLLQERMPGCKIVAATGLAPAATQLSGVDMVLTKPFKITRLHEVVLELTDDAR